MYSNQSGRGNDPTRTSSYCRFSVNFHVHCDGNAIHVSFDGSLGPKVVQIIATSNKIRAFFVVFHVWGLWDAVRRWTISDKIYLRRLRGSRFARAAEDNAALRRSCSGRTTLRVTSLRYFMLFADGGVNATAVRRCGAAANCATLRVAFSQCFYTLPFVRTKR